jgi:hypothetical protein
MFRNILLPVLLFAAAAASAQSAPSPGGKEVSIPLIGSGSVRNFEAARNGEGIYIQSYRRNEWYFARFYSRCLDLPFASAIGFKAFSSMSLDRGDTILVGHERCKIASIVRSGPPPLKPRKQHRGRDQRTIR